MPDATLDRAALAELLESVGDDREFLVELIETYLGDGPSLLTGMRSGLASADAVEVRRAAHTLKSTSVTLGAARLASMSREIEAAAAAGELAGIPVVVDAGIPVNLGAGTDEDAIIVANRADLVLMEQAASPLMLRYESVGSGTLTTRMVVFGYSAFTAGRYPGGICKVQGTLLSATL